MLTPIRVRGKNKRTKQAKKQHSNSTSSRNPPSLVPPRKGRPRKSLRNQSIVGAKRPRANSPVSFPNTTTTGASTLSRLEQLPVEILQKILLFSLNLGLPQASPHLGRALASDHVRTELVLRTFDLVTEELDSKERGSLQSALLRQKWLTWTLLRKCYEPRLGRCAAAKLREFAFKYMPHIQKARVAEMELACANSFNFDNGLHCWSLGPGTSVFYGGKEKEYSLKIENRLHLSLSFNSWWAFSAMVTKPSEANRKDARMDKATWETYRPGIYSSNLVIPEKLLRGPWTQEKGNFLMDLLRASARIDWINSTSGEVASKGLEDAIREDNLHAVRALVFTDDLAMIEAESPDGFSPFGGEKQTCPTHFDLQGPWLCSTTTFWNVRSTVGVVPTTEHLRIAVVEMNCNPQIIWALVGCADKWAIDCDDPEIVQWALADKAKDYLPSPPLSVTKGEYLLRVLENSWRRRELRDSWDD